LKKIFLTWVFLGLFFYMGGFANAAPVTLNFDDLPAPGNASPVPNGYGGMNWYNMEYMQHDSQPGTGYDKGMFSPESVASNGWGLPALVSSADGGEFDFLSAYLTSAYQEDLKVAVAGLRDGDFITLQFVDVNNDVPTKFDFNFLNVDTLIMVSFNNSGLGPGYQFVIDDFTYDSRAVPIPETLLLFGSGVIVLLGIRRRFKM